MEISSTEWVPLPEVKPKKTESAIQNSCSLDFTPSLSYHDYLAGKKGWNSYGSHSSPLLTSQKYSPLEASSDSKNRTPNLTILSLASSLTGQSPYTLATPTASSASNSGSHHVSINPTQLDELWRRFLKTVVIPKDGQQPSGCGCNCHMTKVDSSDTTPVPVSSPCTQDTSSTVRPLTFDISPAISRSKGNPFNSVKPYSHTPLVTNYLHRKKSGIKTNLGTSIPVNGEPNRFHFMEDAMWSTPCDIPTKDKPVSLATAQRTTKPSNTLEKLTLQEACSLMKRNFIANSKRRQEAIMERQSRRAGLVIEEEEEPLPYHSVASRRPVLLSFSKYHS